MEVLKKSFHLLLICFLSLGQTIAQAPTLTSSDFFPAIGEVFYGHLLDSVSLNSIVPGAGGANQTWNFPSLTTLAPDTAAVVSRTGTPAETSFPTADYSMSHTFDNSYFYYYASSNRISEAGVAYDGGLTIVYDNAKDLLRFPMTYNDTYIDSIHGNYTLQGVQVTRSGNVTVLADAYGTLILPSGTFNNVLRVRYNETYTDSFATGQFQGTIELYVWILPGFNYALLSHGTTLVNGQSTTYGGMFTSQLVSNSEAYSSIKNYTISPNPTSSSSSVRYAIDKPAQVSLQLVDVHGKEIHFKDWGIRSPGLYEYEVDVASFAPGLYWANLQVGSTRTTKKLAVH